MPPKHSTQPQNFISIHEEQDVEHTTSQPAGVYYSKYALDNVVYSPSSIEILIQSIIVPKRLT